MIYGRSTLEILNDTELRFHAEKFNKNKKDKQYRRLKTIFYY